jgi:predicted TIM-barrel fold metal-dependent hydrolase
MASDPNRRYVLISSDAHAGADLLDYRPYLSSELHDEFDAWASVFHDPWSDFDDDTTNSEDVGLRVGVSSFLSPYNWDSDKRLEHMNGEGIAAEVVFPNTVPPFYPSGVITSPAPSTEEEYRLRWAGVQAHNRWLVDFCSQAPGRRAGLAQVFLADLDDAVAEVRWAREAGLKGVLIPADHASQLVDLYDSSLDPFWAACTELEMPVHRHSQSVSPAETPTTPAAPVIGAHECFLFFRRSLAHLIYGEVFERFPDLKFVLTETGLTWLPMELQQLEVEYRMGSYPGNVGYPHFSRVVDKLSMKPTDYFRRNCYIGASALVPPDVELRHEVGVDRIMWGSDYPHHEGTYPHTLLTLRLNLWDVPEPEVRAITSLNAAKVYGLDLDHLQKIADEIGPTTEEVATRVTRDELPEHSMCVMINFAADPSAIGMFG